MKLRDITRSEEWDAAELRYLEKMSDEATPDDLDSSTEYNLAWFRRSRGHVLTDKDIDILAAVDHMRGNS